MTSEDGFLSFIPMGIAYPVFGPIRSVLAVFEILAGPWGPGRAWGLSRFQGDANGKTVVSRAGRAKSRIRGHFSGVSPPGFGGFHTFWRPESASSNPYRPPGRILGPFGVSAGQDGPERPKAEKWPYLGLGGPNRESEGTFLGYHPPGLGVSTRFRGPKVRLAPRTGRRGAFLVQFGVITGQDGQNGTNWESGRIPGWAGEERKELQGKGRTGRGGIVSRAGRARNGRKYEGREDGEGKGREGKGRGRTLPGASVSVPSS